MVLDVLAGKHGTYLLPHVYDDFLFLLIASASRSTVFQRSKLTVHENCIEIVLSAMRV